MSVERDHIGIFGKMNSGKSSLLNLLTQQETSIVDATPGTTADAKITLQEIHGMGPVKLFDTAGLDEMDSLGEKKRGKTFSILKECDLILLIVDPSTSDFGVEQRVLEDAGELGKQILVVYNIFNPKDVDKIANVEKRLLLKNYKKIVVTVVDPKYRQQLIQFVLENFESKNYRSPLLPFIEKDQFYILNIPMDAETPSGRYLKPQSMAEEYITRNMAFPVSYRMNLEKARVGDSREKERWNSFLNSFTRKPKVVITDSQAIDIMKDWVPEDMGLTTFSVMMINYVSKGKLRDFYGGVKVLNSLVKGDKILIVEACNHSRIAEDIGTVQIPNYLQKHYPGVVIEHNFGREFQGNKKLKQYKLIIHCGGCMISSQKLAARIRDLQAVGVPYTNYGIFLSYIHGESIVERVIRPWGIVL